VATQTQDPHLTLTQAMRRVMENHWLDIQPSFKDSTLSKLPNKVRSLLRKRSGDLKDPRFAHAVSDVYAWFPLIWNKDSYHALNRGLLTREISTMGVSDSGTMLLM